MKRWLQWGLLLTVLVTCSETIRAQETVLHIGIELNSPPFSYRNEEGENVGFDHEISQALCQTMQRQCEFHMLPFLQLLDNLKKGTLDIVVAGISQTKERKEYMDFVGPYYRTRNIYIGSSSLSHVTEQEVAKLPVAVLKKSIQVDYLKSIRKNHASIIEVTTKDEIFQLLEKGTAQIALLDGISAYTFLKSPEGQAYSPIGEPVEADAAQNLSYIALKKGEKELQEYVKNAFFQIRLNGVYRRINRKYIPYNVY